MKDKTLLPTTMPIQIQIKNITDKMYENISVFDYKKKTNLIYSSILEPVLMYEDILRKEASLQGVKIDEDKLKEFLEELDFGGFTGEEYKNISSPEILEDYLAYDKEEDYQ